MLRTKLKRFVTSIIFLYPINCMAAFDYLYGFDFDSCTKWEFTTDIFIENFNNPEYKLAVSRLEELKNQKPDWQLYVAINQKTYGEQLYGVCHRIDNPRKFECQKLGSFPLSGSTFTALKSGGQFFSTYRCTKSCGNPVQLIYDQSSEDDRNSELEASQKKFEEQCHNAKN